MEKMIEKIKKEAQEIIALKGQLLEMMKQKNQNKKDMEKIKEELNNEKNDANSAENIKQLTEKLNKVSSADKELFSEFDKIQKSTKKQIETDRKVILRELNRKKKLIEGYKGIELKNVDVSALKKEENRLRNDVRLIRVSEEEFLKLTPEQQNIVTQAKKDIEKNRTRLNEVRKTLSYVKLVGNKKPEDILKDIENVTNQVNNNFNLENIENIESFDLNKETKENAEQEKRNDKHNKDIENELITKNKIQNNQKDIEKYKKLLEKYKDDPEKCESFKREIKRLQDESENVKADLGKNINDKSQGKDSKANENKNIDNNENVKNKIQSNQRSILEYMKLLDKYKDNPEKCEEIKKTISNIQLENKKLAESVREKTEIVPQIKNEVVKYNNEKQLPQVIKLRPSIAFDITTGKYTYVDENGKSKEYDFYYKKTDKGDKLYDTSSKEQKKSIIKYAMSKGLTKKQAKMIDDKIYRILMEKDSGLYDKYLETIKTNNEIDKGFDIIYDLRKKNRKIERNIGLKNTLAVTRKALAQAKAGIAVVHRDKSKAKIYGLLAAIGIGVGVAGASTLLNSGNENIENKNPVTQDLDKDTESKENNIVKDTELKGNTDKQKIDEQETENVVNEIHSGDYVKVSEGALLFKDPTDSIRIMSGKGANEKVQVKSASSKDRLYRVTMEAYYSPDGSYISIAEGKDINEELAKKGLDRKFLEDENTVKMYHTVSNGIAQWVSAEDVEKYELKVDKLGNRIEKTDEEKEVDNAYDNYMKQYSKQQEQQNQR